MEPFSNRPLIKLQLLLSLLPKVDKSGYDKVTLIYMVVALIVGFSSCELINPEEEIPAYVEIIAPTLSTTAGQGSASEKITEVWVFVDDEFAGAFPIPAKVPIFKSGMVKVRVEAGIRENGLRSTPDIYPFYTTYEQMVNLEPNGTVQIMPQIEYRSDVQVAFLENFERGGSIFQTVVTGTSTSRISINEMVPFEGQGSGQISLSTTDPFVEIATSPRYRDLLDNGNVVYVEMDYQSDIPVSVGIIGYSDNQEDPVAFAYQAGFNPSETWNKIYFNLTPIVFASDADEFQIVLRAGLPLDENATFTQETGLVLLDNIKLIHF